MPDNDDWLWRPVINGLCSYESVITPGVLGLEDIATMNDMLTVKFENENRSMEANQE
jgi:hypothetical protein